MFSGFWSYVHDDDGVEGGRIVQLAHDIVDQYRMITGESVDLFLDRDGLAWGNAWQQRIDDSLADVAFFIPVLTPRYFASAACRSELNSFARRASALGVKELLLPILYVSVEGIDAEEPADDLVKLVRQFQWEDWRELRWEERTSAPYRRAVGRLAQRLADANRAAEDVELPSNADPRAEVEDDEPDMFEVLAKFETELPNMAATTASLGAAIEGVNELVSAAGVEIQLPKNQTFARRLQLLKRLSSDVTPPAQEIRQLGEDFAQQLHDVDRGVRVAIETARNSTDLSEYAGFFGSLRQMVAASDEGLGALERLADAMTPLESMSRDMRAPLREMRAGITLFTEGRDVMRAWIALLDEEGL